MSHDPQFSVIEETAAEWMVRRDRGLTRAEERELGQWLQSDERHLAMFNALTATWRMLGEAQPASRATASGRFSRFWLPVTLAAAAAIAIAYLGSRIPLATPDSSPFATTATTMANVVRKVDLPDGSVIHLNSDSAVDVQFDAGVRRVVLRRGEAHFAVARNARRPFVVNAGGVDVRVVGTVFNVRLGSDAIDVLVTEGKVRVAPRTEQTSDASGSTISSDILSELTAGQKVSIARYRTAVDKAVTPIAVSQKEISATLAWQAQRLDFDATPLAQIVAEFNRHNQHQLLVADPQLNERRFGGTFPASDHETFVRMLEADFGVLAERRRGETVLRLKAP